MLRNVLLVAIVFAGYMVLADHCGAVSVVNLQEKYGVKTATKGGLSSIICPLCVDLVQIAETYAECGEGIMEGKLDAKCEALENSLLRTLCLTFVNDVCEELEKETEQDANKICSKVTHTNCEY